MALCFRNSFGKNNCVVFFQQISGIFQGGREKLVILILCAMSLVLEENSVSALILDTPCTEPN